jgi:hypothetical protein
LIEAKIKGGSLGIWAGQSSRLVIKSTMILFNLPIKDYRNKGVKLYF